MNINLIRCTLDPEALCGEAAAICTDSDDPARSMRDALSSGHQSIMEHAIFTFRVEGASRVLLAQLTRHRIASFSVQSQRYCGVRPEWVVPQTIVDAGYKRDYLQMCGLCYELMCDMIKDGVPAEDARYVIPQGVTCKLIVTMNARELWHLFELRCCNRAQWEIHEMAVRMLTLCKQNAPALFASAGPACLRGPCPEGKRSCGHPMKEVYERHDA